MIQKLLISFLFLVFSSSGVAATLTIRGDVFEITGQKKFFEFERYSEGTSQRKTLKNIFKNTQGKVVLEEVADLESGQLKNYKVTQRQTGEGGEIVVADKTITFSYRSKDGKVEKETETLTENFIVGMTLVPYLEKNWGRLLKGSSVKTRMGVWHRAETVGFKFWKDREEKRKGRDLIIVVMKPTSFIIRALVDPLYLTFDKVTKELLSIKGRTSPKVQKNGEWKDFDAFISYSNVPQQTL